MLGDDTVGVGPGQPKLNAVDAVGVVQNPATAPLLVQVLPLG